MVTPYIYRILRLLRWYSRMLLQIAKVLEGVLKDVLKDCTHCYCFRTFFKSLCHHQINVISAPVVSLKCIECFDCLLFIPERQKVEGPFYVVRNIYFKIFKRCLFFQENRWAKKWILCPLYLLHEE